MLAWSVTSGVVKYSLESTLIRSTFDVGTPLRQVYV